MRTLPSRVLLALSAAAWSATSDGDPSCWLLSVQYDTCCDPAFGPRGNTACWDGPYTYMRCCETDCLALPEQCRDPPDQAKVAQLVDAAVQGGLPDMASTFYRLRFMSTMYVLDSFSPVTSFMRNVEGVAGGVPGYGTEGGSARMFRMILCIGGYTRDFCKFAAAGAPVVPQETFDLLSSLLDFYETFHRRGTLVFRLALQVWRDCCVRSSNCPPRSAVAELLAVELDAHQAKLSGLVLGFHRFMRTSVQRMGTLADAAMQRAANDDLIDHWLRTIELYEYQEGDSYQDLIAITIKLAIQIFEAATLFFAQAFAHFYLTQLVHPAKAARDGQRQRPGADAVRDGSRPLSLLSGWRYIFEPVCCFRYHILLQLLQRLQQQRGPEHALSMVEVGVHRAMTAEYILRRLPSLNYVGVDPYVQEGGGGDEMFAEARGRLSQYGKRARLARMHSSLAWNSTGKTRLAGVKLASADLVFVDGDHEEAAVIADLGGWSNVVRRGGLVVGHDIFNPGCDGVTEALMRVRRGADKPVHFASDYTFWWTKE